MLNIKASYSEHKAARSNGCVYGLVNGIPGMFVYAELGEEDDYIPGSREDLRQDRRLFKQSKAFFALTEENLNEGIFEEDTYRGKIIVFR